MKTIVFDERSYKWDKDPDLNPLILKQNFKHLESLFNCRGYLYLNRVYEYLDIKWDPNDENICYKKEDGPVKFDYELTDFNTYRIIITR